MKRNPHRSTNPLIAKVPQLLSRDLALENDYLWQENRILRSKLGSRVPLTEAERRVLLKHGLRISNFRDRGFFVIRRGDKLLALSAICAHRKCTLAAEPDCSFYCQCHCSTFDPGGHVTKGPAKRDLPMLAAYTNAQGQLIVAVPAR